MKKHAYRQSANSLSKTEAAYVAGIVDGEGCFSLILHRGCYFNGAIEIANTAREFLEDLRTLTGVGRIVPKKRRNPKAKRCYCWAIPLCSIGSLLKQISPFIRLKKKQADIFARIVSYDHPCKIVDDWQRSVIPSLRNLNRRGVEQTVCN